MSATVFDTPLDARGLIEASAGTGKTYALAGLFARAVIVGRLRVPQILAVTYTVAATQELHERVRLRLQQAAELAQQWREGDAAEVPGDSAETALLRRLIHAALHDEPRESLDALRLRLQRAAREMDLAAITTIHGFCQRVLAEHALETGQPLLAPDVMPGNAAQRSLLAVELWRDLAHDPAGAAFLQAHFGGVDALAEAMRTLLSPEPLLPLAPQNDAVAACARAWDALWQGYLETGEQARAELIEANRKRVLSSARDKAIPVDELFDWLAAQDGTQPLRAHPLLSRLTHAGLERAYLKSSKAPLPEPALLVHVEAWLRATEAADVQRLHALRDAARRRDAADKQAYRYVDFDDLVNAVHAAAVDPNVAPGLSAALREQFALVLVDEFQDTDARQWTIFERLFGEGGLLLVGDPKQAIYRFRGGDVETYLLARGSAALAAPLRENFRSRPCVLAAVNAMFEAAPQGVLGQGIGFLSTGAGGKACDEDLLIEDAPARALIFHRVPPRQDTGKEWNKRDSIRIAAQLCADAIRDLLHRGRKGRAQRVDRGRLRTLQPRDFAVLVRTHDEGAAIREELARRNVPAVTAGRGSIFASEQAQMLLMLLLALAAPGDERRLRALLATPLFGFDAAALCALDDDGEALRRWQDELMHWRLRWERHGPQALLADVLARQASQLLVRADGERELTYLLQLGELMQEARSRRLGPQGQLDWLQGAITHADADDETQWPRLESDAGRVQILTLHKSKGLEFPLVFLPFAGIGRGNGRGREFIDYHDDAGRRVRQWRTDFVHGHELPWKDACRRAEEEEKAEDMRLLYVGLTRARDALWLCGGALASSGNTALHRLLGGNAPNETLIEALGDAFVMSEGLPMAQPSSLPPPPLPAVPEPRVAHRVLRRDWWIHSFSQLHRQRPHGANALVEEAPADDERPLAAAAVPLAPVRFGGTRFGNALHLALERVDFARWCDVDGSDVPEGQHKPLVDALRAQDYAEADLEDGVRELAPLIARTLNAPLPTTDGAAAVRLCELAPAARLSELEFHFTLADTDTAALLALLHRHGVAADRQGFGAWPSLSGLMNGKIDLTYRHDGRIYVLDYKSNLLPDYGEDALAQAMRHSEYDLQALLYVVALHRWLRLRLGAAYDYARDFGGVRYVFCRGLEPDDPARGVIAPRFDAALVEAADALFAPNGGRA
ncbi:exodeoxyribonuclease V subunit beta [Lysobacter sp.]|uniref:exodeoxyribonuclease V subunit beta n=1 Tax=Lysobacter sp. TaxID=72226 RepID=UPI002D4479C5|nr:exodeoxyribonuclease V subunit beta [Lysobacter sp.]HZX76012.1 exodeoxyribonuclease V subunit beta [Lysobacter sp.]